MINLTTYNINYTKSAIYLNINLFHGNKNRILLIDT